MNSKVLFINKHYNIINCCNVLLFWQYTERHIILNFD